MTRLLCIGEAIAELRFGANGISVSFGGDTFNTAVYAARRVPGWVGFLTRASQDPLSDSLIAFATAEGLDPEDILRDPERNLGIYSVSTDASGERSFHYWRQNSAARRLFERAEDLARIRGEIIYLSGITVAILPDEARCALRDRLADLRSRGARVAFDPNYRPRLWPDVETARAEMDALWALCDIALPSLDNEVALHGGKLDAALEHVSRFGIKVGAVKRGSEDPVALSGAPAGPFAPASRVINTTAAGDSFNAAYLVALLAEQAEAEALHAGHDLAAQVIGQPGAIT